MKGFSRKAHKRFFSETTGSLLNLWKIWPALVFCLVTLFFYTPQLHAETAIYGDYNRGCISGAQELPESGAGFQSTRRQRLTHFGAPETISTILKLGKSVADAGLGVLLIGNLSNQNGGPLFEHSISHQNGLDFDISYKVADKFLTKTQSASFEFSSILTADQKRVDPNQWDDRMANILKITAENPDVERILVHPVIKKHLCDHWPHEKWFAKIRPWWKHDNHFHVRLKCPQNSKTCISQDPPPDEIGCEGEAFLWWFSDEAELMRQGKLKKPAGKAKSFDYPSECRKLIPGL